jgi:hypothetical protein
MSTLPRERYINICLYRFVIEAVERLADVS